MIKHQNMKCYERRLKIHAVGLKKNQTYKSGIENDRRIETKRQISLQISRRYLMKGMRKQK